MELFMEKIIVNGSNIELYDDTFDIEKTMECGQAFHFEKFGEGDYGLVHRGKFLKVKTFGDVSIFYNTTKQEFDSVWRAYFDLDKDYDQIIRKVTEIETRLLDATKELRGMRLLKQDFFECMISFIISQNNRIPQIKKVVAAISKRYGKLLAIENGVEFYSFPTANELKNVNVEEYKELKCGFRAEYIKNAVEAFNAGTFARIEKLEEEKCLEVLTSIKGIGAKVASCIMLFSLSFYSAFPVDVWMKRIMEDMYFGKDTDKKEIERFGREKFGAYSGYAQQYLFEKARKSLK